VRGLSRPLQQRDCIRKHATPAMPLPSPQCVYCQAIDAAELEHIKCKICLNFCAPH